MTWTRVATAAVLIPVVVVLVLYTSTVVVAVATAIITVLALWEYFALGDAIGHRAYRLWTAFCAVLLVGSQWLESRSQEVLGWAGPASYSLHRFFPAILELPSTVLFVFVLGITALMLWAKRPLVEALPAVGISSSALLLVALPLSYAVRLHNSPLGFGPVLLLFALVITWTGDTTAYFVGRAVGKHPLAPHISPKKTWEGAVGSMVGSLLAAAFFGALSNRWVNPAWAHTFSPMSQFLIMGFLGNIAGQMGDLLESAYKRSAGVKDSGGLLPGHGGVLDRIDALILCIPVIWYYLVLAHPVKL